MASDKPKTTEEPVDDEGERFVHDMISRSNSAKKESPRAFVIVMTAHVDNFLTDLLKAHLTLPRHNDDELFQSWGPLYNFGPRIDLAYRLGLLSTDMAWLFHQVRRLRDECAHLTDEVDLDRDPFKQRIANMHSRLNEKRLRKPLDAISQFENLIVTQLIWLWYQKQEAQIAPRKPQMPEWIFTELGEGEVGPN